MNLRRPPDTGEIPALNSLCATIAILATIIGMIGLVTFGLIKTLGALLGASLT